MAETMKSSRCSNCKEIIERAGDWTKHLGGHLSGYICEKPRGICGNCGRYLKYGEVNHLLFDTFTCITNYSAFFNCKDCSENLVNCVCEAKSGFVSKPENDLIKWLKK